MGLLGLALASLGLGYLGRLGGLVNNILILIAHLPLARVLMRL